MEENQRLKQVIGLFFNYRKSSSSSLPISVIKKCLFHRWRICLTLKHMYLNKVSHLSQSPTFAAHLILKTMTVQTYLSSWGKFVKFLKRFSFLDEVWNNIQDSIKGYLHQTSIFRGHIAYSCSFNSQLDQANKFVLRFSYFFGFSITICTIF